MQTVQSIITEIPQMIQQFSGLIQQKVITVPFKVNYAIAQQGKKARAVETAMHEFRKKLIKECCTIDKKGNVTVVEVPSQNGQPPRQEMGFIDADRKQQFSNAIADYLAKEVKFEAYKFNEETRIDFEKINNIPPSIIDTLLKYEII